MRLLILIALFYTAQVAVAQPVKSFQLLMKMDGRHVLDNGDTTNIWGFAPESAEGAASELRLPSPTIRVEEGDSVVVRVINPSEEGHTIHWHGLDVDQANDGVPAFSQFVLKGDTFHYRFRATHAGNYIYHCHVTTTLHLMMGMYGSFIVERPDKRVYAGGARYDRDYDYLSSEMDQSWNDDYTMTGPLYSFQADQFLLNGKGGSQVYADTAMQVQLLPGDTVLLRLLNIGYAVHTYSFPPDIEAWVVGSDGRQIPQAYTASSLSIYPGERYSVIITTKSGALVDHIKVSYESMIDRSLFGLNYIPVNTDQAPLTVLSQPGADLVLYPNPFSHVLDIKGAKHHVRYSIINLLGQQMAAGEGTRIPADHLPAGWYVVMVLQNGTVSSHKVYKPQ